MHIAIVGCGQLARMLALAGWEMGHRFSFLADPGEDTQCVDGLGPVVTIEPNSEASVLYQALGCPDILTVEKEHVSVPLLSAFSNLCTVAPCADAIHVCQHRGREKNTLRELGIETAPFHLVNNAQELRAAVETLSYPCFVKSCELGYDGQHQWFITNETELSALAERIAELPELVVEGAVRFDRELSLIAVRSANGDVTTYPLVENRHREGILLTSEAPADRVSAATQQQAVDIAERLLNHWDYVGVLSIELFDEAGALRVNELAPRVHNSGHWTQDAGVTSQFANHVRAIAGQTPGHTHPSQVAGMVNLLGRSPDPALLQAPDVSLHWYTKTVRGRRKVGHLNLQADTRQELQRRLHELEHALYPDNAPL